MAVGAIIGGIGTLFGAASSLFGSKQTSAPPDYFSQYKAAADSYNKQAQDIYNQQVDYAKQQAAIANKYQTQQFLSGLSDYNSQYDYQWNLSVSDWQNQVAIQDFEALQQQKLYQKSLGIATSQLNLNDLAQDQAFAFEDFNLKNLMKQTMFSQESELIAVQNAIVENRLNSKSTGLDLAGVSQQEALLGIQKGGLGIKFQELGIQQKGVGLEQAELGTKKAGLGIDYQELGIQQKALALQAKQLGLKKTGLVQEAQFVGKEETLLNQKNAIAQQFIEDELNESKREATFQKQGAYVETLNKQGSVLTGQAGKSRGKAEQVVLGEFFRGMSQLESTLTGQNRQAALRLKELQSQTNFDKAKLQLKRDQLGLQARGMILDERQLGLQAEQIGLAGSRVGLQGQQIDIQGQQLGLQGQQIGLAGAQLGLQGQQLGVQGQQLGTEAQRIGLQQQRYDVALENTITDSMFNMKVLDAEVMQAAEQATLNKKNIAIQKYGSDLNTVAQMMIKPSTLPTIPAPSKLPEQTFIVPPKIEPGFIAPPIDKTAFDYGYRPSAPASGGGTSAGTVLSALGTGLKGVGAIYGGFSQPKSYQGGEAIGKAATQ
jgi:hypothetical protein